jgi:mRNA-degrading endonuclease toxin of MazEF toxin-antitoxin module
VLILTSDSTIGQQRLGKRIASLSGERMREVCSAPRFALGCD